MHSEKDKEKNPFDFITKFFEEISNSISSFFKGIGDFFGNIFEDASQQKKSEKATNRTLNEEFNQVENEKPAIDYEEFEKSFLNLTLGLAVVDQRVKNNKSPLSQNSPETLKENSGQLTSPTSSPIKSQDSSIGFSIIELASPILGGESVVVEGVFDEFMNRELIKNGEVSFSSVKEFESLSSEKKEEKIAEFIKKTQENHDSEATFLREGGAEASQVVNSYEEKKQEQQCQQQSNRRLWGLNFNNEEEKKELAFEIYNWFTKKNGSETIENFIDKFAKGSINSYIGLKEEIMKIHNEKIAQASSSNIAINSSEALVVNGGVSRNSL